MSEAFDAHQGPIIIRTELSGPSGRILLRLALDTGATRTLISIGPLATVGCDPSLALDRVQATTGSRVESMARLPITHLKALGQERANFPVLAHTLPSSIGVDSLLGLDFLRGRELNLDFRAGRVELK